MIKIFYDKNFMTKLFFQTTKFLGQKKNFMTKKFLQQKIFGPKNSWLLTDGPTNGLPNGQKYGMEFAMSKLSFDASRFKRCR